MRIRQAFPGDIPALAGLAAASYRTGFAGIISERGLAERGAAYFVARFAGTWITMRVAEDHGVITGFSMVSEGPRGPEAPLHIHMLFVSPERVSQGIGRALLADAERMGAATLECFAKNDRARLFYDKSGWRATRLYTSEFAGELLDFVWYERAVA
jgi:putative acetyltransferase